MKTKSDPYATKLHKRIDALLLLFIVVVILLLLRPVAKGDAHLAVAFSSVRPFWSTLAIFNDGGSACASRALFGASPNSKLFGAGVYDQTDRVALAGLFSEQASTNFSPMIVVDDRKAPRAVAPVLDPAPSSRLQAPSSQLPASPDPDFRCRQHRLGNRWSFGFPERIYGGWNRCA